MCKFELLVCGKIRNVFTLLDMILYFFKNADVPTTFPINLNWNTLKIRNSNYNYHHIFVNVMLNFSLEALSPVLDIEKEKMLLNFALWQNENVQVECTLFPFRFKHKNLHILYVGVFTNGGNISSFSYNLPR